MLLYVNLLEVAQIPWHDLRVSKCHQLRSATEIVTFWGRHIFTPTQHDNDDIIVMLCVIHPYISNTHVSQRSCTKWSLTRGVLLSIGWLCRILYIIDSFKPYFYSCHIYKGVYVQTLVSLRHSYRGTKVSNADVNKQE